MKMKTEEQFFEEFKKEIDGDFKKSYLLILQALLTQNRFH